MALSVEVRLQKTKGWDWRELEQLAYDIGYRFLRHNGTSHRKYFHRLTNDTLVIPTNKDLRRTDAGIIGQLRECWERINMVEEPIIDWKQKIREIRVLKGWVLVCKPSLRLKRKIVFSNLQNGLSGVR